MGKLRYSFWVSSYFCNLAFSLIAPFYPLVANKRGLSSLEVGFAIGIFSGLYFIVSATLSGNLGRLGRKRCYVFGMGLQGITMCAFGFLEFIHGHTLFLTLSLVFRALQGIGSGMAVTAAISLMTIHFKDQMQKMLAENEGFTGLGLMMGPTIGGLLYHAFGFLVAFEIVGGLLTLTVPVYMALVPEDNKEERTKAKIAHKSEAKEKLLDDDVSRHSHIESECDEIMLNDVRRPTFMRILMIPRVFLGYLVLMGCFFTLSFYRVILSVHLKNAFGMDSLYIALVFASFSLTYIICGMIVARIPRTVDKRPLLSIGLLFLVAALFLSGPFHLNDELTLPNSLPMLITGVALVGFAMGFIIIPSGPEFLLAAKEYYETDGHILNDYASGVFNNGLALGLIFGPILGGVMDDAVGYRKSCTHLCIALALLWVIYTVPYLSSWKTLCQKRRVDPSTILDNADVKDGSYLSGSVVLG